MTRSRQKIPALALAAVALLPSPGVTQPKPPAAAERTVPLVPSRLVGRWTDTGDCGKYVIFRSDGTFLGSDGGQGTWRLVRDQLTLSGPAGSIALTVRRFTGMRMTVVNPDGSVGTSQRC